MTIKCFNFSREFLTSGSGSGVRLSSSPTSSPSSTSISSTGVLITLTRILSLLSFPISYLLLFVQPLDMLFRGSKTILINRSLNPRSAFKTRKWILHLNLASVQLHEGETYSFCSCKHFGFVCNYKHGLGGGFPLISGETKAAIVSAITNCCTKLHMMTNNATTHYHPLHYGDLRPGSKVSKSEFYKDQTK